MPPEAALIADSAPLSVEQATGLLGAREPEDDTPDATLEAVETESEAEPTAEELELEPEEAIEGETTEGDEPEEAPAIKAPHSWDAEARAEFHNLPRKAQQVIVEREAARDKFVTEATEKAATARKTAESEVQAIGQLKDATQQVLQQALKQFQSEWQNDTPEAWAEWARTDPAEYVAGRAKYEAQQQVVKTLTETAQQQAAVQKHAFDTQKIVDLKTMAPDLLDPIKGTERIVALETYILKETGIDRQFLETLDARVIVLAQKAMKYDAAVANRSKQPPAQTRPAIRPGAAPTVRTPQRAAEATRNRFTQTRNLEDAVAVLDSRK